MRVFATTALLTALTFCAAGHVFAVKNVDFSKRVEVRMAPIAENAPRNSMRRMYGAADRKPELMANAALVQNPSAELAAAQGMESDLTACKNAPPPTRDMNRFVYRSGRSPEPGMPVSEAAPKPEDVKVMGSATVHRVGGHK